jgi:hypothetical protein
MSKYKSIPTVRDGIRFASQREANRYQELKAAERAGIIRDLQLQVPFTLDVYVGGCETVIGKYVADFTFRDKQNRLIVEDTKGVRTPLYRWKKKHFEAQYGIRIIET